MKFFSHYKGIQNKFCDYLLNNTVDTDKVTDKRFIIPIIISVTGKTRSMEINYKLSLNDNNVTFDYIYTDANVTDHPESNTLKVYGRYFMISMLCFRLCCKKGLVRNCNEYKKSLQLSFYYYL